MLEPVRPYSIMIWTKRGACYTFTGLVIPWPALIKLIRADGYAISDGAYIPHDCISEIVRPDMTMQAPALTGALEGMARA